MFKQQNSRSRGGNGGWSNGGGNRSRGSFRNVPKKLDHRLFIQAATENTQEELDKYEITHSFDDFQINETLKKNIAYKKYTVPTPIQDQAIPVLLEGNDVIGIANTGTGKTAAFLIPLIHKVAENPNEKVLIIAPTRELALQIREELFSFTYGMQIRTVLTIGGTSMMRQRQDLQRNHNFIIGTPGRIIDLIEERLLDISSFQNVVLDEVDRMVDIGFIKDIQYLISLLPRERQSLFFSATITDAVKRILSAFVKNAITISVKTTQTAHTIDQTVVHVNDLSKKMDMLHDILAQDDCEKVIVFGRTKRGVEKLSRELQDRGFRTASIHGNKSQGQRQRALQEFKTNRVSVLLATDVAARGIDIDDVSHVINYDAPESYDDYVHRIGRTGRCSKKGIAITFVEA